MKENNEVESQVEVSAQEFTPATMVSFLLQNGYTVDQIHGRIAASDGFVQTCLTESNSIQDKPDGEMSRLKDLYLRELVKSVLRYSPFTGHKKGAERLGLIQKEYEVVYRSLIQSGEVTFVMEIPDWLEAGSKKMPLKKHIVK